jgi:ribosomal protein S18 acetylase RimI-like enzyme
MYSIRSATPGDIPLIRQLCLQVWPQTYAPILPRAQIDYMLEWMYSPASLQQQMQDGVNYLLCHDDESPTGFASFADHGNGKFKLEKIYVLPPWQGKGAGKHLINHIVELVTAQGANSLQLQVNKQNPAKGFYEKLGFAVKEAAVFDIGNGFVMDDYIMELALPLQKALR